MSLSQSLGPFHGLRSATAGDVPLGYAGSIRNVRVGDGRILPRYGFRSLAGAPAGLTEVHGLARLSGYGADYGHRLEWVTVEKRAGTIKPYAVDPTTWARTEITNGGATLSLNGGDWLAFSYDGTSYWVNPGGSPSVYQHDLAVPTSWTPLEDAAYAPQSPDPTLAADLRDGYETRGWLAATTDAYSIVKVDTSSGGHGIITNSSFVPTIDANGALQVSGTSDDNGYNNGQTLTVVFAAAMDLAHDYCAMVAHGAHVAEDFHTQNHTIEVRVGGVWIKPDQRFALSANRKDLAIVFRLKGLAGTLSGDTVRVEAVRMTFWADPWSGRSGLAWTVDPLVLGGTYLGATASANRPWSDSPYKKRDESFGIRYHDPSAPTATAYTGVKALTHDASVFGTLLAAPCGTLGDVVTLAAAVNTQAAYDRVQFVRKDVDGNWRLLGDAANAPGASWVDRLEAWELATLPIVSGGDYVAPPTPPVFTPQAFVGGVPFKGWVVWFASGGKTNVRHSAVGNATSLHNEGSDPNDEGRPADFTLADDFADEPLGGVQAGDALLVLGRQGAYGQSGNSPSGMTPFRKLPGSMGGAGRFAFCRYRGDGGSPGMAWLDASGDNVWFAQASGLQFASDVQGRPVELSAPIRGTLRAFLLTEQLAARPGLALADARMDVDEATGSLWIVLGSRAAILRPPSLVDGHRPWELSDFALGAAGTVPVPGTTAPYGATAFADAPRGSSTLAWSNPAFALPGPDVATAAGFLPGLSSHGLAGTGFVPAAPLPADATVTGLKARVRHRATSTGTAPCAVALSAVGPALPAHAVPSSFEDFDVDLAGLLPLTPAGVNAGIDLRIAYDATTDPKSSNPAYWSFNTSGGDGVPPRGYGSPGGSGPYGSVTPFDLVATYTGPLPAPSAVYLSVRSVVSISGPWNVPGDGFLDNGQGTTSSGPIDPRTGATIPPADSTVKVVLAVSGGVANLTLVHTRSNTGASSSAVDFGPGHVYPTVASPDPATVAVESVLLVASYATPVATGARSIAYLAFGPRDEGLVWLRSSGHLDAAEWCPTGSAYVEGPNRDGGLAMPEGWWESGRMAGTLRRLARVEAEREGFGPLSLAALCERVPEGEPASLPRGQRWGRFSTRVQGRTHRIRVRVDESTGAVRALDLAYDPLAGPGR